MKLIALGLVLALCTGRLQAQWDIDVDGLAVVEMTCVPSAPGKLVVSGPGGGWGVRSGTCANVKQYYKRVGGRLVNVGGTLESLGIYPVPWCHLDYDATLSTSFYWCGEHIWDEFIPQPDMIAHPALTCNLAPIDYDFSTVESHFNQLLIGNTSTKYGLNGLVMVTRMRFLHAWGTRPGRSANDAMVQEPCVPCRASVPKAPGDSRRLESKDGGAYGANLNTPDGGLVFTAR